jgi:hypothetical protein
MNYFVNFESVDELNYITAMFPDMVKESVPNVSDCRLRSLMGVEKNAGKINFVVRLNNDNPTNKAIALEMLKMVETDIRGNCEDAFYIPEETENVIEKEEKLTSDERYMEDVFYDNIKPKLTMEDNVSIDKDLHIAKDIYIKRSGHTFLYISIILEDNSGFENNTYNGLVESLPFIMQLRQCQDNILKGEKFTLMLKDINVEFDNELAYKLLDYSLDNKFGRVKLLNDGDIYIIENGFNIAEKPINSGTPFGDVCSNTKIIIYNVPVLLGFLRSFVLDIREGYKDQKITLDTTDMCGVNKWKSVKYLTFLYNEKDKKVEILIDKSIIIKSFDIEQFVRIMYEATTYEFNRFDETLEGASMSNYNVPF